MKTWTKEDILHWLNNDDAFLIRALNELYLRQTEDERKVEQTRHTNHRGFNSSDAKRLTSIAKWSQRGSLTSRQIALVRHRMQKYAAQITEIANQKTRSRHAAR